MALIADRAYDANRLIRTLNIAGVEPVIPPKRNRKKRRLYNKELYKERNIIERLIGRLKQFRRVATRYDKTQNSYLAFISLAALLI